MTRAWLAALAFAMAMPLGADGPPAYTSGTIVNSASYAAGPMAPNSLGTIFGTDLSFYTQAISPSDIAGGVLPDVMGMVRVIVDGQTVPLLYVSDKQINFLVPSRLLPGSAKLHVVRQSVTGPAVDLLIAAAAPQLFAKDGYAVATRAADYSPITVSTPAAPGEIVVLYGTGFGLTDPKPGEDRELPNRPYPIKNAGDLTVSVGGRPLDRSEVFYCGVTPGFAGLYQINLRLPAGLDADPEVRVAMGDQSSPSGVRIAVQGAAPAGPASARQLSAHAAR